MFFTLISVYIGIITGTILTTWIICEYIKSKPPDKLNLTQIIGFDLTIVLGSSASFLSTAVIIRELTGPFHQVYIVEFVVFCQQELNYAFLASVLSFQFFHALNVFFSSKVNELPEEKVIVCHRVFVLGSSLPLTLLVCKLRSGICRPIPLYFYFLNGSSGDDNYKGSTVSAIIIGAFISLILTLQVLIEVKKRVIEKAENKVDNLAVIALKQIQDAKYRYDVDNMMELKVQNLRNLPEKTSSENDLSEKTLSEHYLTIKESVKESISQNQAIESSTKFLSLSNQSVRMARALTLFGIVPVTFYWISASLENINGLRPHVTTASNLFMYGVFVPAIFILNSPKLKAFAGDFFSRKFSRFCSNSRNQITPTAI